MPEPRETSPRPFEVEGMDGACVRLRCTQACEASAWLSSLGLSRQGRASVLSSGRLSVEGRAVRTGERIEAGSSAVLSFVRPERQVEGDLAVPPARIVWHDRLVLAAEKPQGLLVHGDGTGKATLTESVEASVAGIALEEGWPFVPSVQALMRLDVDTSGLVLFSLTPEFQPAFDALVAGHDMGKCYLAIVKGRARRWPREISAPIARDRHDARRMRVGKGGKEAVTRVGVLDERRDETLLAIRLLTGRRHQIRVHLAHMGHPIVGDALYGGGPGSLMLHASSLSCVHPLLGTDVRIVTDWPRRFAEHFAPRALDWSILC